MPQIDGKKFKEVFKADAIISAFQEVYPGSSKLTAFSSAINGLKECTLVKNASVQHEGAGSAGDHYVYNLTPDSDDIIFQFREYISPVRTKDYEISGMLLSSFSQIVIPRTSEEMNSIWVPANDVPVTIVINRL